MMHQAGIHNSRPPKEVQLIDKICKTGGRLFNNISTDAHRLVNSNIAGIVLLAPNELTEAIIAVNLPKQLAQVVSEYAYGSISDQIEKAIKEPTINRNYIPRNYNMNELTREDYLKATSEIYSCFYAMPCFNRGDQELDIFRIMLVLALYIIINIPIDVTETILRGDLLYAAIYSLSANDYNTHNVFVTMSSNLSDMHTEKGICELNNNIVSWKKAVYAVKAAQNDKENLDKVFGADHVVTFKELVAHVIIQRQTDWQARAIPATDAIIFELGERFLSAELVEVELCNMYNKYINMLDAKQLSYKRLLIVFIMNAVYASKSYPMYVFPSCAVCGVASTLRRRSCGVSYCGNTCAGLDTKFTSFK